MRAAIRVLAFAAAAAAISAGDAGATSLFSYGLATSDASVNEDGRTFRFYVHPHENLLLIQPSAGSAWTKHPQKWPQEAWKHAAATLVAPAGCAVTEIHVKSRIGATWEAGFACPAGVDLRALMMAQRAAITHGEPLRLEPATASAEPAALAGR
jgi:hypothetical protein